jgi:hypothetical protein
MRADALSAIFSAYGLLAWSYSGTRLALHSCSQVVPPKDSREGLAYSPLSRGLQHSDLLARSSSRFLPIYV